MHFAHFPHFNRVPLPHHCCTNTRLAYNSVTGCATVATSTITRNHQPWSNQPGCLHHLPLPATKATIPTVEVIQPLYQRHAYHVAEAMQRPPPSYGLVQEVGRVAPPLGAGVVQVAQEKAVAARHRQPLRLHNVPEGLSHRKRAAMTGYSQTLQRQVWVPS